MSGAIRTIALRHAQPPGQSLAVEAYAARSDFLKATLTPLGEQASAQPFNSDQSLNGAPHAEWPERSIEVADSTQP